MSKKLKTLENRVKIHEMKADKAKRDLEALKIRNTLCLLCKKPFGDHPFCRTARDEKLCAKCFDNQCACSLLKTNKRIYCQDANTLKMKSFCTVECCSYLEEFNKGLVLTDAYVLI